MTLGPIVVHEPDQGVANEIDEVGVEVADEVEEADGHIAALIRGQELGQGR